MAAATSRRGFALLTVLALTAAIVIAVGAVVGYVSNATRQTAQAIGRDVCRLAAQSGIEIAKARIYAAFSSTISASARVIGVGSSTTSAFDWFSAYSGSSAKRTIGTKNTLTLPVSSEISGCTVRTGIARVEHTDGEQFADVTIVAEAVRQNPGGTVSSSTIAETVRFAQQRSKVFNNAYFVNNYGWFQGSGCTANGDVRANGDMYLDSSCKINGNVYASRNDELHVDGDVTGTGKMDSYSTYKSTTYGAANAARPLAKNKTTGETVAGGYDAPDTVSATMPQERIKERMERSVEMPYIGDVSSAASEYRAWAQELHDADSSMSTIKQGGQTIATVYYDGTGPSGQATVTDSHGNEVAAADYGVLVLEGTQANPIEISGPVIVPNDVIIKGYVKGQGTIYSGRNIHIVGNIQYVNPPTWANKASNADNSTKDMLGLMAKGNIVLGDYTQSSWLSSINKYISQEPYVQQYACDTSDAAIGYPETFGGSYSTTECVGAEDFAKCSSAGLADFVPGGYDSATGRFGKLKTTYSAGETVVAQTSGNYDVWDSRTGTKTTKWVNRGSYYTKCEETTRLSYDRKYYESVCTDDQISSRASTITRIDAILYNNHGIFGKLGKCSINGSLVCRNEGINYSSNLYLNWDLRLFSGSSETVDNDKVGLAKGSDNAPAVVAWMEIPQGYVAFDGEDAPPAGEGD